MGIFDWLFGKRDPDRPDPPPQGPHPMVGTDLPTLVRQIILEKVQAGEMFTAYDITLEARRRGAQARHDPVKDIVHQCHQDGTMGASYTRTVITVSGGARPFLYHRYDADPSTYPGQPVVANPPVTASSATPPPARQPAAPKPRGALNLDAGDFLPISRAELKETAQRTALWDNPWFGRRDLIPPADDPRTKLIDRALVTNGLLSAEELAEIHRVGAEMERLRPTLVGIEHQARAAGEAAVQAEREEKARLKAQKKAEAAERKQRHAEAVARRKATDILFLGRGVSGRLGDRQSDLPRLASLGLPALSTPAELAAVLGLSISRLRWLAFHTEVATRVHYTSFTVPKKSGGTRTLSAPHRTLAKAQQWVFANIVSKLPAEPPAHGFLPGRSILSNAQPHAGRAVVVNMDLEGFFPSITFPRVRSVFHRLGYSPAVATILALLCTECPRKPVEYAGRTYHVATGPRGLPQGACTSPGLSNQVARRLDKRLNGLAVKMGLTYTRYADDLTFSGDEALKERVGYLMARVRHLAEAEGFAVNHAKSRVLRRHTAQRVTGLVVNDRPGVRRQEVRRLRAILHRARTEGLAKQNRTGRPDFLAWLQGKIAFVSMARPEVGAKLKSQLQALLQKPA
jgi:retron-type reverse transcriptase